MSRRLLALLVALSALLLALTVPATGQVRTIKPGISAAGVDLSGLTVEQAAALLDQAYAPRLQGDMILGAAGVPWKLTMAEAQLKLDSVRTAKRALYAKAGVTTVPPAITHSRTAVRGFVERVAARVRKTPKDAAIKITVRHIFREKSHNGRALPIDVTRAGDRRPARRPGRAAQGPRAPDEGQAEGDVRRTSPGSTTRSSRSTATTSSCASSRA